jgi:hypothetical protein
VSRWRSGRNGRDGVDENTHCPLLKLWQGFRPRMHTALLEMHSEKASKFLRPKETQSKGASMTKPEGPEYTVEIVHAESKVISAVCGVRTKLDGRHNSANGLAELMSTRVNEDYYVTVLRGAAWMVGDTVTESDEV